MQSLRQALTEAEKRNVAIGHFNTSDLTALRRRTRTEASRAGRGSEGAREFIGTRTAAAIVRSLRDESPFPIFLNVDHTYSLEKVKEVRRSRLRRSDFRCIEATARREPQPVEARGEIAKSIRPEILVEGEICYIGSSSAILEKRREESLHMMTSKRLVSLRRKPAST
jgi:fructose/tagatose bisphosphate aldolase